ncbi:hypothetical protein ACIBCT_37770 [Streptosporangium sp. NPDC050855]|uniref:hypothetical protein n=1 Tax=Streptosporangium sp. NPDC050855 TaxID=3366194 RepID=UPI0037B3D31D
MAAERALGEDDAERAYEHTKVARRFAARIGVIREAVGIAAYRAGHFAEALSDLRAARRMTGSDSFLPVMADCERGLGRPERALDLVRSKEAERLDRVGKIELAIVESGARRDLGQNDAAVITLQRLPELRDTRPQPWSARLAFAYADALAAAGHEEPATEWFGRAMAFDEDGETDAAERYAELTGSVIEDLEEDEDDEAIDAGDALADDEIDAGDTGNLGETGVIEDTDDDDDVPTADDVLTVEDDEDADEDEDDAEHGDAPLGADAEDDDLEDLEDLEDLDDEDDDEEEDDRSVTGEVPAGGSTADAGPSGDEPSTEAAESGTREKTEPKVQKAGKADLVGPAFIEPDFGDILSDVPDIDPDDEDEIGPGRDGDSGRAHRSRNDKK